MSYLLYFRVELHCVIFATQLFITAAIASAVCCALDFDRDHAWVVQ